MKPSLADRLQWVLDHRDLSQESWASAAGLSRRYVATTLHRARRDASYLPGYETLVALARAADVPVEWLAEGRGSPDQTEHRAPATPVVAPELPPMMNVPTVIDPLFRAVLLAYRAGLFEPEVVHAVLTLIQHGKSKLPATDEADMVRVMGAWLRAASRLVARGEAVTIDAIAWELSIGARGAIEGRTEALNHEAQQQLKELGVEPPSEPVLPPKKR